MGVKTKSCMGEIILKIQSSKNTMAVSDIKITGNLTFKMLHKTVNP